MGNRSGPFFWMKNVIVSTYGGVVKWYHKGLQNPWSEFDSQRPCNANMSLIDGLIKDGWLKTDNIIEAFRKIKREDFLDPRSLGEVGMPEDMKKLAELNEALPIGQGQTISQPLTVAFMLELLQPKRGDEILDVGSGSGWTTALLAQIVRDEGKVVSIEIIPELKEFGEKNISRYNFLKKGIVRYVLGDGSKGYKEDSPYDKILASAAGEKLPVAWKEQLKVGGRIVCPIESSVWLFVKKDENDFESIEYPGFAFVPLISKQ